MPAAKPAAQPVNKEAATISGASTVAKRIPAPQVRDCGLSRRCLHALARRLFPGGLPPHVRGGSNAVQLVKTRVRHVEGVEVVQRCRLKVAP